MRVLALCAALGVSAVGADDARAQCAPADSTAPPLIRIEARAQAAELSFARAPDAGVRVEGCATNAVNVLVRANLPEPVTPGVTYRAVDVHVEIVAHASALCSPVLLELIESSTAQPRLAALCAARQPPSGNRRLP